MSDNISHPAHYQGKYECIDLMREIYGDEAVRHFCICNAYKYRFRAGAKQGETAQSDIAKAEWYEAYMMEHLSRKTVMIDTLMDDSIYNVYYTGDSIYKQEESR